MLAQFSNVYLVLLKYRWNWNGDILMIIYVKFYLWRLKFIYFYFYYVFINERDLVNWPIYCISCIQYCIHTLRVVTINIKCIWPIIWNYISMGNCVIVKWFGFVKLDIYLFIDVCWICGLSNFIFYTMIYYMYFAEFISFVRIFIFN